MKKLINRIAENRVVQAGGLVAVGSLLVSDAFATTPTDLPSLASSVDFSTVQTALLTIAAAILVVLVAWAGIKFVLKAVKAA